jgi:putative phosphoesterase
MESRLEWSPRGPDVLVSQVYRAALAECPEGRCAIAPVLETCARDAVASLASSRVQTFVALLAIAATLAAIDAMEPDAVYCLGDLVGYGARPNETIVLIRERNIPTIIGNYDDGVGFDRDDCGCAYKDDGERARGQQSLNWSRSVVTGDHKAYLRDLPFDIRVEVEGVRLRLVHGSPRRINEYLFEDRDPRSLGRIAALADADVLVFGHTHKPWIKEIGGVLMVNAGSAGKPKDGAPRACWVLITIAAGQPVHVEFHRVPYDIAAMAAAIRAEPGLPDRFARDLETGGV